MRTARCARGRLLVAGLAALLLACAGPRRAVGADDERRLDWLAFDRYLDVEGI